MRLEKDVESHLSHEEHEALKKLKANDTILIVPADKGRAVVVLDKDTYLSKMNDQLNDDYVEVARGDEKKLLNNLHKKLVKQLNSMGQGFSSSLPR